MPFVFTGYNLHGSAWSHQQVDCCLQAIVQHYIIMVYIVYFMQYLHIPTSSASTSASNILPSILSSTLSSTYPSTLSNTHPSTLSSTHPSTLSSTHPSTLSSTHPSTYYLKFILVFIPRSSTHILVPII